MGISTLGDRRGFLRLFGGAAAAASASSACAAPARADRGDRRPGSKLGATFESWFSLAGLNVFVTGAGSGRAQPVALAMGQAGARVIVGDASLAQAQRVARAITADGGEALPLAIDVADEQSVLAAFAEIRRQAGRLDVIVLGATHFGGCPIVDMTVQQWDWLVDTNLRGAFLCSREAVRMMIEGGRGGRIIALSTIGSLHPVINGNVAYGPSKAGLNQLMRNIAHDHAKDGVRANAILPGNIPDDAPNQSCPTLERRFDPARLPFGRGPPEEVARLAVFLAGPSASYISGQSIAIDGAFSAL